MLPTAILLIGGNNNLVWLVIFCVRFKVIFDFENRKENRIGFVVNEIILSVAVRYVVIPSLIRV